MSNAGDGSWRCMKPNCGKWNPPHTTGACSHCGQRAHATYEWREAAKKDDDKKDGDKTDDGKKEAVKK